MNRLRTVFVAALGCAALLTAPGCDAIEGAAGLDDIEVSTGNAGRLQLVPNATVSASASVNVSQNLPGGVDVEALRIPEGSVSYTPRAQAAASAPAAPCMVAIDLFIEGTAALAGSVTVDESAQPYVRGVDFPEPTRAQLSAITTALRSGTFTLRLDAENSGACAGVLVVDPLEFGLGL